MAIIVQKYGGTSVGSAERIRAVCDHIAATKMAGNDVVIVVSAMGKTTDELVELANAVSSVKPAREMDMLLTAGERISMALVCMALAERGIDAISLTGSQAGIITDTVHQKAKIVEVKGDRIISALEKGQVPVVAGFQGVSTERDITTLGRGGSDTTAVALAAFLNADVCEIYTDVDGVFSADPRLVPNARKITKLSYEEMLDIAATGGRVLALRSVEFARNYNVKLHVKSSFTWEDGTIVCMEEPGMEQAVVSAVTHDVGEAKITVVKLPDKPGIAARLFKALADKSISVDMIVQNTSVDGTTDISFTVPKTDMEVTVLTTKEILSEIGGKEVIADDEIARVSIVGAGMRSQPGVTAKMFETLAEHGINIEMISTSSIRISCVIRESKLKEAVNALHEAFELNGPWD